MQQEAGDLPSLQHSRENSSAPAPRANSQAVSTRPVPTSQASSQSISHSLLASSTAPTNNRKSLSAGTGYADSSVKRASISLPSSSPGLGHDGKFAASVNSNQLAPQSVDMTITSRSQGSSSAPVTESVESGMLSIGTTLASGGSSGGSLAEVSAKSAPAIGSNHLDQNPATNDFGGSSRRSANLTVGYPAPFNETINSSITPNGSNWVGSAGSTITKATKDQALANNSSLSSATSNSGISGTKDAALPSRTPRPARSVSTSRRRLSGSTATSTAGSESEGKTSLIGKIGVCALDSKARSRPSRSILTRLQNQGEFEVIVFGDKVILDEDVENWPICDFLISFFSDGFPLEKAIRYANLRKPFVVNDLVMQKILWDRRLCLRVLDKVGVPTPRRLEVNRDGGPRLESASLARRLRSFTGLSLEGASDGTGGGLAPPKSIEMAEDGDVIILNGKALRKPFVEKPANGEDHNVMVYFPRSHHGGGGRRLFRKIGNKSSEFDPDLVLPRCMTEPNSSYIYEQFLDVENAEDIKAYTVGPDYCHAETRKSPVVDGLVRRNPHGKELRYMTKLTPEEAVMATKITKTFGQRICGFDLLRAHGCSYVIDVNGWSFVKDNTDYYDKAALILRDMFTREKHKKEGTSDGTGHDSSNERPRHDSDTAVGSRAALKTLLKSPSMSKIQNHLHRPHGHKQGQAFISPDSLSVNTPVGSPLKAEEKVKSKSSSTMATSTSTTSDQLEMLPPPIITSNKQDQAQSSPTSGSEQEEYPTVPPPNSKHSWKLKGMVAVVRHADRTPKQKFKFTFHTQPFVDLLKGYQEEILLKGEAALASVEAAVRLAVVQGVEDQDKLRVLLNALIRKGGQTGTKVQIKPMFRKRKPDEIAHNAERRSISRSGVPRKLSDRECADVGKSLKKGHAGLNDIRRSQSGSESMSNVTFSRYSAAENDLILDKLQLVIKWGGEPTHSARYQCQELGQNMRDDMKLMNREILNDVRVFTSSEKRVSASAMIWAASFLDQKELPPDFIFVRKDLLDDSNAAKDVMDKVKKKLKLLLREGNSAPAQFAWPKDTPEPSIVMGEVVKLMKFHRRVMRHNYRRLDGSAAAALANASGDANFGNGAGSYPNGSGSSDEVKEVRPSVKAMTEAQTSASIQSRWCTGEDAKLFKERWEKLFVEFCDSEKADPSKISELYDSCKFDALHNRSFLEWIFMPSQALLDEIAKEEQEAVTSHDRDPHPQSETSSSLHAMTEKASVHGLAHKIGLRRRSVATGNSGPLNTAAEEKPYFKLFSGSGETKLKSDKRLTRLRDLYRYAKILFDYIGPQEYGISYAEKLEIGLLTSLPLLREVVQDLEELQASPDAKSFVYFTKESHIYTLLNCILEGGIETKIPRALIPELDYLSQIRFELYEAKDNETAEFAYSIRISISPGCHTLDPLDVSLDSKHAIGQAPARSLTAHQNWKTVIETLKEKFDQVELPPSFLALNISESHAKEMEKRRMENTD